MCVSCKQRWAVQRREEPSHSEARPTAWTACSLQEPPLPQTTSPLNHSSTGQPFRRSACSLCWTLCWLWCGWRITLMACCVPLPGTSLVSYPKRPGVNPALEVSSHCAGLSPTKTGYKSSGIGQQPQYWCKRMVGEVWRRDVWWKGVKGGGGRHEEKCERNSCDGKVWGKRCEWNMRGQVVKERGVKKKYKEKSVREIWEEELWRREVWRKGVRKELERKCVRKEVWVKYVRKHCEGERCEERVVKERCESKSY